MFFDSRVAEHFGSIRVSGGAVKGVGYQEGSCVTQAQGCAWCSCSGHRL